MADRQLDLVLYGATGFTGSLVAEYLAKHQPEGFRWALAGRSASKLEAVRQRLAAQDAALADLPILVADSRDRASLDALATATKAVCTTVGPYARYGYDLVAACVDAGTDYCDLTGETHFVRHLIDRHHEAAQASGARIVPCCGFDSIPSDLGTWALQREVEALHGRPCEAITLYVDRAKGGVSGGTIASMLNIVEEATRDPSVRKIAGHPYALNPEGERSGPDGSDQMGLGRAPDGRPTAPFVMAAINTRVVRRSNALLGYAYGRDFRYAEVMRFPATPKGQALALGMTAGLGALMLGLGVGPTRRLLAERVLPKPGEGPSADEREAGYFRMSLEGHGHDATGKPFEARYRVEGDLDPGYGQTAVMLGEAALCLALDPSPAGPAGLRGGVLTPASALGAALLERLRAAGMRFELSG